ncbi:MAG: SDR family NAD(P)-dependent oxidoreductase [Planctomycetes bacterium]|nr:SDR family NAD(P)-dependent oxidoreductase [Planctomycetota bacterium]
MTRKTARRALVIGNSDGIGRTFTDLLLAGGWEVSGLSRSALARTAAYAHVVCDVTEARYPELLAQLERDRGPFDLVTHCVGIGSGLDETGLAGEPTVFETNLMSLVRAVAVLAPSMVERRAGLWIGLSSIADDCHIADAPSYSASKAGLLELPAGPRASRARTRRGGDQRPVRLRRYQDGEVRRQADDDPR